MQEIIEKFSDDTLKNLDKDNISRIISFLEDNDCDYVEDIVDDYLDLFTIDYDDFVKKYNKLNEKYHGSYLMKASEDMNLFEEFFYD